MNDDIKVAAANYNPLIFPYRSGNGSFINPYEGLEILMYTYHQNSPNHLEVKGVDLLCLTKQISARS